MAYGRSFAIRTVLTIGLPGSRSARNLHGCTSLGIFCTYRICANLGLWPLSQLRGPLPARWRVASILPGSR